MMRGAMINCCTSVALHNSQRPNLTIEALHGLPAYDAQSAKNLHGGIDGLLCNLRGGHLRHGCFHGHWLPMSLSQAAR